jgi:hypothetical protein
MPVVDSIDEILNPIATRGGEQNQCKNQQSFGDARAELGQIFEKVVDDADPERVRAEHEGRKHRVCQRTTDDAVDVE